MIERKCKVAITEKTKDYTICTISSEDGTPPDAITVFCNENRSVYNYIVLEPQDIPEFIAALSKVAAEGYEVWGR